MHLIRASLLSPLTVIVVNIAFSLIYLASWIGRKLPDQAISLTFPNPFAPWEAVFLFSVYGVPTAYLAILVIGIPFYFVSRKLHLFTFWTASLIAAIGCIPITYFFNSSDNFTLLYIFLLSHSLAVALTFVWLARTKANTAQQGAAANP